MSEQSTSIRQKVTELYKLMGTIQTKINRIRNECKHPRVRKTIAVSQHYFNLDCKIRTCSVECDDCRELMNGGDRPEGVPLDTPDGTEYVVEENNNRYETLFDSWNKQT